MAKLTVNLLEGGSISLESKEGFIELTHIGKDKKEKKLGLLQRGDFLHLRNFIESSLAMAMEVARAEPSTDEAIVKGARAAAREIKRMMDKDEGEEDEPPALTDKD